LLLLAPRHAATRTDIRKPRTRPDRDIP